ncbi:MAG: hypothetical protein CVU85_05135 [Firmicutes bacterium HGW-Firmicutes-10]|nr:MAG: hypothetical protein CVU85_05135 [Firmicutes bacterium HGW-Firmicutes-10]
MFYKKIRSHLAILLLIIGVAAINQTLLKFRFDGIIGTFFNYYFNDVLAALLILVWTNFLLSLIHRKLDNLVHIFLLTLSIALFWEYITPLYQKGSTSDLWDVAAYLLGGVIYTFFIRCFKKTP